MRLLWLAGTWQRYNTGFGIPRARERGREREEEREEERMEREGKRG